MAKVSDQEFEALRAKVAAYPAYDADAVVAEKDGEIERLTVANDILYERLVDRNAEVARLRSEVVRLLAVLHVMEMQLYPGHPNRGNDGSLVPM